ncbi:MAG: restriction endonuclease subunit S [Candidatus Nanoarchaeia archaeon]|nr:restriction endonuclease subunit S [Candidatus Nanoarchaeia archaeon]
MKYDNPQIGEWNDIIIGNEIEIIPGFAFSSKLFNNKKKGLPLIRIRDLDKKDTECYYDGPYNEEFIVNKGDLLIGMDGEFNVYIWKGGKALLNQRVCKISPRNPGAFDKMFLYYSLQNPLKIRESQIGQTTVKHLSRDDFYKIKYPIPKSNEERKAIAIIFLAIDKCLEKINEEINTLENIKIGFKNHFFKEKINQHSLGNVSYINENLIDPRKSPNTPFTYVDIESVKNGGSGEIVNPKILLGKTAPSRARRLIKSNDLIMSTVRPYLKAIAIIPEKLDNQVCSTGFGVITPHEDMDSSYIFYSLLSEDVMLQCKKMMSGGQYPAINESQLKKILINKPSKDIQIKISTILFNLNKKQLIKKEKILRFERIKKGLMNDLLTGKRRVNVENVLKIGKS